MPASSLSAYRSHRRSEVNPSRADITAIVSSSASLSVSGVLVAGRTGARSGQSRSMSSILTYIAVARVLMSFSTTRSWRPSPLHAGHPPGITHLAMAGSSVIELTARLQRREPAATRAGTRVFGPKATVSIELAASRTPTRRDLPSPGADHRRRSQLVPPLWAAPPSASEVRPASAASRRPRRDSGSGCTIHQLAAHLVAFGTARRDPGADWWVRLRRNASSTRAGQSGSHTAHLTEALADQVADPWPRYGQGRAATSQQGDLA